MRNCDLKAEKKPGLRLVILTAGLMVLGLAFRSGAYFEDLGLGVRPFGMGEAFTAVADDSNAALYNSAGLADLTMRELNLMYSSLYSNLNARLYTGENDSIGFHNLGVVIPFDKQIGNFGAYWTMFNSRFYKENTFLLSYGRSVHEPLYKWLNLEEQLRGVVLNAGMNLKVLNWQVDLNEYTLSNPVLGSNNSSRTGFTADISLLAETPEHLKFGLSLENFIPANVGVTVYETVPINFRFGVSYRYDWLGKIQYLDSLLGAVDFTQRNGISDVRAGVESWFLKNLIALRCGTTVDQFNAGASFYAPIYSSEVDFRLDYALGLPYGIKETWGTHRFSLIVRWGKRPQNIQPKPLASQAAVPAAAAPAPEIPPEENMAAKREEELAAQRTLEANKLKGLMDQLNAEIQKLRAELEQINEMIKLGQIPSIQFESGKTVIRRDSYKSLDQIGAILAKHPQIKVRLEGHTDNVGTADANLSLSQQRVEAVKEYLIGVFKLSPGNIIPVGYGPSRPVADNATPEGRAANRRVEIKVLIPAGMETYTASDGREQGVSEMLKEPILPEDTARYEDVDKIREKIKVYEMQMNQDEVEELLKQQHQKDNEPAQP